MDGISNVSENENLDKPQDVKAEETSVVSERGGLGDEGGAMGVVSIPVTTSSKPSSTVKTPVPATEVDYKWGKDAQKQGWWWGLGRRKSSVARVRIRPGNGELKINKRPVDVYFSQPQDLNDVLSPLKETNTFNHMDVYVNVKGGGVTGQAQAIRLGIARALKVYDCSLEQTLRDHNFLTRDARAVERKKPGQRGARRRFQFSKR